MEIELGNTYTIPVTMLEYLFQVCNTPEKLYVIFLDKRESFIANIPVILISDISTAQWNVLKLAYTQHIPTNIYTSTDIQFSVIRNKSVATKYIIITI